MFYVYILESQRDKSLYTGYTDDLRRRISEHNCKKSKYTKTKAPFDLIYYEAYKNKKDAMAREVFLKSGWGRAYTKRTLKHYFFDKNLGG